MKRLLLTVFTAFFAYAAATAQLAGIVVESANDGTIGSCAVGAQPAGTTTYRIYAELQDPTDFFVGVSANLGAVEGVPFSCHPIDVTTTTTFFNTAAGAVIGDNINALVFCGFVPDLSHDTWVTIGNQDNTGTGTNSSWTDPADPLTGPCSTTGASLTAEDGAWYALPGAANGFGVGANNRVLLGQFTTDGDFSFNLNVSVLDEGVGGTNMFYAWNNDGGCVNGLNYQDATGLGLTFPSAVVPGCTDATACNYDATATEDDASCEFTSCAGCTDDTACNYDATATIDDASCEFTSCAGCTDASALNYDDTATLDDGSCLVPDCTDAPFQLSFCYENSSNNSSTFEALNAGEAILLEITGGTVETNWDEFIVYDGADASGVELYNGYGPLTGLIFEATSGAITIQVTADGSNSCDSGAQTEITFDLYCGTTFGCTDQTAGNYDASALTDDGSCLFGVPGCTNVAALNYDAAATADDGSCIVPECMDAPLQESFCYENGQTTLFTYEAFGNNVIIEILDGQVENTYDEFIVYDGADNTGTELYIGYGPLAGLVFESTSGFLTIGVQADFSAGCASSGYTPISYNVYCSVIEGCTDDTAANYDSTANTDDGSCLFGVPGCTDATACNYDPAATTDDGSCDLITCAGCTDASALNYDATATLDDGSCAIPACSDAPQNFVYCYDTGSVSFTYEEFVVGAGVLVSINEGTFETCCDELIIYDGADNTAPVLYDGSGVFDVSGVIAQSTGAFITLEFNGDSSIDCASNSRVATDYDVYCSVVEGCTDDTAANYDATANTDDGSCSFEGCTDVTACNYSANATTDDGSCEFTSCAGCTDASALNYDDTATIDDASCIVPGCADAPQNFVYCYDTGSVAFTYEELTPGSGVIISINAGTWETCCDELMIYDGADNTAPILYDGNGVFDVSGVIAQSTGANITIEFNGDGSVDCTSGSRVATDYDVYCGTIFGCTDDTAVNYDEDALTDDGSCQFGVAGCTDVAACNYDATATFDDGTCTFAEVGQDCNGNCLVGSTLSIVITSDEYPGENAWTLTENGVEIASGGGDNQDITLCVEATNCYEFTMTDTYGDGQFGSDFGGVDGTTTITLDGVEVFTSTGDWGDEISGTFGTGCVLGCTDANALNFDPAATVDDGSCLINDVPADAFTISLNVATGPGAGCNGLSNQNMAGAQIVSVDGIYRQTNPDLWYSFTPFSSGNRIQVQTTDFDALIEVFDSNMNPVNGVEGIAYEDDNLTGDEIFHAGDLTAGELYYIRVAPYFAVSGDAMFDICVQTLRDTRCDYGPGPYSQCQLFKADFCYSNEYIFNFTSQTTQETYSSAPQTSTFLQLSNVEGLLFGDDYDVAIEAVYMLEDGAGNEEMIVVANDEPCTMSLYTPNTIALRDQDNSVNHGPHFPGNYIRANSFVCSADRYRWKFTRTDVAELPVEYTTNTTSTWVRISDVLGADAADGGVYDVQVQPVFDSGQVLDYGAVQEITILGVAGIQGDVLTAAPQTEEAMETRSDAVLTDAMVYPNPSTGENITINLSNIDPSAEQGVITVTDFVGRTVASFQITLSGSTHQEVINLNNLASGTYLMNINVNGEMMTEKIVIAK